METVERGAELLPMSSETRGQAIKRRREDFGIFSVREFKKAAESVGITVDRDLIGPAERGEADPDDLVYDKLERVLDRLEEASSSERVTHESDEKIVKFRVSGNFGVDVVIEAPVSEMAEAEASAVRLLRQMQARDEE